METLGQEKWLGCIFKVGDDVRQVCLPGKVTVKFELLK